jgi:hypothetical protein
MSRNDRTAARRRIALGLGTAAGGLLAAALIPMATASAQPEPDPFTDLGLANAATLDALLPASLASPLDTFIDASPIDFTDNDFFAELLGPIAGAPIDTLYFNLDLGPIDAIWDQFLGL